MTHHKIDPKLKITLGIVLVAIVAFTAGYVVRDNSETSSNKMTNTQSPMSSNMSMSAMDHGAMVNSEPDFIMEMIPHHQEAVDSSMYMLGRTSDPEFKVFLQNIITAQQNEIVQMKTWHQEWFNKTYEDDGRYKAMMPNLEAIQDDEKARQQYLMGMIMHHKGAVQMASKIKTITKRPELLEFADAIITVQNQEIETMRGWMMGSDQSGEMNHMMH